MKVSIWGNFWHKSKHWEKIKHCFKGNAIYGKNYVKAVQGSKICLGFISHLNRDEYTIRSVEIPYAGSLLCAERTKQHLKMFKENEEAVYWSSKEECLNICKKLLKDENLRNKIKFAGFKKVKQGGYSNKDLVNSVINTINQDL